MRFFYYLSSCDSCKRIRNELSLDESIIQIDIKKSPITKIPKSMSLLGVMKLYSVNVHNFINNGILKVRI